jgi:hypothetical protein
MPVVMVGAFVKPKAWEKFHAFRRFLTILPIHYMRKSEGKPITAGSFLLPCGR